MGDQRSYVRNSTTLQFATDNVDYQLSERRFWFISGLPTNRDLGYWARPRLSVTERLAH